TGACSAKASFASVRHSTNVVTTLTYKKLKSISRISTAAKFLYLFYDIRPNMFFMFIYKSIPVPMLIEKYLL
ncbi:hypothetical protein SAMN04488602_101825, partial [Paenibacillus sp. cl123]